MLSVSDATCELPGRCPSAIIPLILVGLRRTRPGIQPKLEALRTLYEGKKIIVGRDKLDVVKGVFQKVRCVFPRNSHQDTYSYFFGSYV
jgi:hypothetical protein